MEFREERKGGYRSLDGEAQSGEGVEEPRAGQTHHGDRGDDQQRRGQHHTREGGLG
jgi:hypothetical protein